MSEKKRGWIYKEVVGIGILNPRLLNTMRFKSDWALIYYYILCCGDPAWASSYSLEDGTYAVSIDHACCNTLVFECKHGKITFIDD